MYGQSPGSCKCRPIASTPTAFPVVTASSDSMMSRCRACWARPRFVYRDHRLGPSTSASVGCLTGGPRRMIDSRSAERDGRTSGRRDWRRTGKGEAGSDSHARRGIDLSAFVSRVLTYFAHRRTRVRHGRTGPQPRCLASVAKARFGSHGMLGYASPRRSSNTLTTPLLARSRSSPGSARWGWFGEAIGLRASGSLLGDAFTKQDRGRAAGEI